MQNIKMFENLVCIKNNINWVSSPAGAAVYQNSDGRQSKQLVQEVTNSCAIASVWTEDR